MELPHPSHPSHLVSGKHSSSIPHSCSPIDGLVHPNSWPFTPSSFLSLLQSPKLSFWHSWFLITVLFTIWHQKIVKGQLKAPSFSACTSTWTCPFPNRTISMPEPGSQKHQFYDIFYEIIAIARFLDVLMIWMIRMILLMGCPSPYLSESESADKMETSTLWGRSHLLGSLQFRNMSFVHELIFHPRAEAKMLHSNICGKNHHFPLAFPLNQSMKSMKSTNIASPSCAWRRGPSCVICAACGGPPAEGEQSKKPIWDEHL